MEYQPQQLGAWIAQAKAHWQEHQPKRYKALKEAGKLAEALKDAAVLTSREMETLIGQGFQWTEAWEMVREQHLFPPEEPGASPEARPSEGYRLYRDIQQALAMLGQPDEEPLED